MYIIHAHIHFQFHHSTICTTSSANHRCGLCVLAESRERQHTREDKGQKSRSAKFGESVKDGPLAGSPKESYIMYICYHRLNAHACIFMYAYPSN